MTLNTHNNPLPIAGYGGGKSSRLLGLDILRVALALLVFMFHSRLHFECDYGFLNNFVDMGAIAMTGFMLLSGYTLTNIYIEKNILDFQNLKRFYLKRIISILPLYYTIALLFSIYDLINGADILDYIVSFPIEAICLQSVFSTLFPFSHNGGTWFISCIMICYILFPFVMKVIADLVCSKLTLIMFTFIGILLWSPFVQHIFHLQDIYSNPFFRLLEFSIGCMLARLQMLNSLNKKNGSLFNLLQSKISLVFICAILVLGISISVNWGIPKDFMLYNWLGLPCFMCMTICLSNRRMLIGHNPRVLLYLSTSVS